MANSKFAAEDESSLRALSVEQVLDLTGICRPKLYQEIKEGRITARKIGRRTFILASDLAEYLRSRPVLKTVEVAA